MFFLEKLIKGIHNKFLIFCQIVLFKSFFLKNTNCFSHSMLMSSFILQELYFNFNKAMDAQKFYNITIN